MLATALTAILPTLITVLLLVVGVILILKSRRTHEPGFIWLAVAVVVWPIVSRLLERWLGSPFASPLNLIQQFVGVCILLIAVLRLSRTETRIHDEDTFSGRDIKDLQKERVHLETLFADRINFYLVFAAGVLAFLFDEHHKWLETPALVAVVVVSVCMLLAFWRTFRLVKLVLDEICEKHSGEVYSFYAKRVWEVGNANWFLLMLPLFLTAYFVYALVVSLHPASSAIYRSAHPHF